jgi:streptogramin lyase
MTMMSFAISLLSQLLSRSAAPEPSRRRAKSGLPRPWRGRNRSPSSRSTTARPRIEALEDRCLLSYPINEFPLPSPNSAPNSIVAGPDGNVWFAEDNRNTLARITPAGQITEFSLPFGIGQFVFGPDGNIWAGISNGVAEITPQGAILHNYVIPSATSPQLAVLPMIGPDGNIWYTEPYQNDLIGRITPAGQITEFPIPGDAFGPDGAANIITGPDGNLWFDATAVYAIGRITPNGTIAVFALPNFGSGNSVRGLTAGPDGNLWMAADDNQIYRVNTAGQLTGNFAIPTPNSGDYGMTVGSDGALWFTESSLTVNQIGRITTNGVITDELPIPSNGPFPEEGTITNGPDGNIWFNEYGNNRIGQVVLNHPPANVIPTLAASTINEGQSATLGGTFTDPDPLDSHTVVVAWGDGSANTTLSLGSGVYSFSGVTHTYQDNLPGNAPYPITVTVTDNHGASASGSTSITVLNVPPTVGALTGPLAPVPINTPITVSASFTDPGVLDTHTAVWDWDLAHPGTVTSAGTVTETNGSGTVTGSHNYTTAGVYTVKLTVTDKDGASGTSTFSYVVVYDASAGFVTGGGWFTSPAGAYAANPALTGPANFGLNAKYKSGDTVPTGNTEFQFPAASLNFHATSYDWLVITGSQAQYQGSATINGAGNYGFLVTAQDNGGSTPDKIRIEIWDKSRGNAVVYDTQPLAPTSAAPTTALGGGRIQVHTGGPSILSGGAGGSQVPPAVGGGSGSATDQALAPLLTPASTAPFATGGGSPGQTRSLLVAPEVRGIASTDTNAAETTAPALPRSSSTVALDRLYADLWGSNLEDVLAADALLTPLV